MKEAKQIYACISSGKQKEIIIVTFTPSCISDNKMFWRTEIHLFSTGNHEDDGNTSEMFNNFFSNAVKNVNFRMNF